MSTDASLTLGRRYYAECAIDDGDPEKNRPFAVVDELLTADFVMHYNNESVEEGMHGRDAHKAFLIAHTRGFRGERWTVEVAVANADTIACQWRIQTTHTETGTPIDLRGADFFTVQQGRLAALHRFLDFRTLDALIAAGRDASTS